MILTIALLASSLAASPEPVGVWGVIEAAEDQFVAVDVASIRIEGKIRTATSLTGRAETETNLNSDFGVEEVRYDCENWTRQSLSRVLYDADGVMLLQTDGDEAPWVVPEGSLAEEELAVVCGDPDTNGAKPTSAVEMLRGYREALTKQARS